MMSATTSATTGRRYGLERVCRMWDRSRSALYARRARARRLERGARPARRGPTPALSDAQLLAAIRSDLARSPFQGEGHRKVHARLRILDGVRVARTRVLRVMRAQGLLSPHRGRQGDPKAHDGTIVTSAPCVLWGTDGVRVFTAQDGWVWTFAAVDHWNAECVGWHVCKVGESFCGPRAPLLGHPPQFRLPHRTGNQRATSTARSRRTWPAGWRCGWITAASICRTMACSRGIGARLLRRWPLSAGVAYHWLHRRWPRSRRRGVANSRRRPPAEPSTVVRGSSVVGESGWRRAVRSRFRRRAVRGLGRQNRKPTGSSSAGIAP